MQLIVAGGRDFTDYNLVKKTLDKLLLKISVPIRIVSGRCSDEKKGILTFTADDGTKVYGADGLGERYAKENDIPVLSVPANWKKYGRSAGPKRNRQMAALGTHALIFWDEKSRGSYDMITAAKEYKLKFKVIYYEKK